MGRIYCLGCLRGMNVDLWTWAKVVQALTLQGISHLSLWRDFLVWQKNLKIHLLNLTTVLDKHIKGSAPINNKVYGGYVFKKLISEKETKEDFKGRTSLDRGINGRIGTTYKGGGI